MRQALPGEPLKIPASTFNTMLAAADDYQRRALNQGKGRTPFGTQSGIVTVKNDSGGDCEQFAVLGISGVLVTPASDLQEFTYHWALTAVLPTAAHCNKFVVLQEPIANNALGKAMVFGTTPVWMYGDSSLAATTAGIEPGETDLVPTANAPGAQILYEQPTSGVELHLALVRLPAQVDQALIRMRVISVQGDYLVCRRWTGSLWSEIDENVAKPYLLRTSIISRNGINYSYTNGYTRTATQGASNETQVIVPSYYTAADEIFAAPVPHTGVMVSGKELRLIDANLDGRAWAKQ
jgi:hypothetical protein